MEYVISHPTIAILKQTIQEHSDVYGEHPFEAIEMAQSTFNELMRIQTKLGDLSFRRSMTVNNLPIVIEPERFLKYGFIRFKEKVVRCPLLNF